MPEAGRLGDKSSCPSDSHGCKGCSHSVEGPAVQGSGDVFVNSLPILREGDMGVHSSCCGPNTWQADQGSATVFANGMPVHRLGDATKHCGGDGNLVQGSPNVFVGDSQNSAFKKAAKNGSPFCEN